MVFVVKVKVRCTMTGDVTKYIVSFVKVKVCRQMISTMTRNTTVKDHSLRVFSNGGR